MPAVLAFAPSDRGMLRDCRRLGLAFVVATLGFYVTMTHSGAGAPRDGSSLVLGRDFLNLWMYGRAAVLADPGRWYDLPSYQQALGELLGPGYPGQNWSYPPSVMLLAAPFGCLPYLAALALWTVLGLAMLTRAMRRHMADEGLLLPAMASPAAVFCVISGQSALLTAAMMVAIFALLDRRPLVAGLLIGCLTLKPQLGLLFPVMLAASGRWRVFAAAAGSGVAIVSLTALAFGPDVWVQFVRDGLPSQARVMADLDGIATPFFPTMFMNLRGIGASPAIAMTAQGVLTVAAACAVAWAFRTRRSDPRLPALFCACSVAATPYLLSYDTLPLAIMALAAVRAGLLDAHGRRVAKLVFWLPLIQMTLGLLHVPGAALIAPALAVLLVRQLRGEGPRAFGAVAAPVMPTA